MSKHTPTPWADDDIYVTGADDFVILEFDSLQHPEDPINKARLLACVNAFHSEDGRELPTERIEPGLVWALWDAAKDFHEAMSLNPSITAAMYGPDFDLDKRRKNCAEALAALLDKMEG